MLREIFRRLAAPSEGGGCVSVVEGVEGAADADGTVGAVVDAASSSVDKVESAERDAADESASNDESAPVISEAFGAA